MIEFTCKLIDPKDKRFQLISQDIEKLLNKERFWTTPSKPTQIGTESSLRN